MEKKFEIINENGKVKEYNDNNKIIFECEYLKGKIRNRKEYNNYGELLFEGEYLNGKRNGKGKEYNDEDELNLKENI